MNPGNVKGIGDKALKEQIERLLKNNSNNERNFISYIDEFIATKSKKNTIESYTGTKNKIMAFDGELCV